MGKVSVRTHRKTISAITNGSHIFQSAIVETSVGSWDTPLPPAPSPPTLRFFLMKWKSLFFCRSKTWNCTCARTGAGARTCPLACWGTFLYESVQWDAREGEWYGVVVLSKFFCFDGTCCRRPRDRASFCFLFLSVWGLSRCLICSWEERNRIHIYTVRDGEREREENKEWNTVPSSSGNVYPVFRMLWSLATRKKVRFLAAWSPIVFVVASCN